MPVVVDSATDLLENERQGFAIDFLSNTYAVRLAKDIPHNPDWTPINDSQDPNWSELAV